MTKAEKAAWEEYPFSPTNVNDDVWDDNKEARAIYQRGYEQAERHIIKKACSWLSLNIGMLLKVLDVEYNTNETDIKDFIKDFKQAMEE